jgi:hypothetical protein
MTLGELFGQSQPIVTNCPSNGPNFAAEIKIDLRNAFSHGLYWWSRDKAGKLEFLWYAKKLGDSDFHVPVLDLNDIWAKQNLLTTCFVETIGNLATSGYFKAI